LDDLVEVSRVLPEHDGDQELKEIT
jgi:hypothetical protein